MSYPLIRFGEPRLGSLEREINQMLGHLRNPAPSRAATGLYFGEDEGSLYVEAIAPGLQSDAIEITFEQGVLEIKGHRDAAPPEVTRAMHQERPSGEYQRRIKLRTPINADAIQAAYKDGILTITLPKSEAAKPRRIEVQTQG